MLALVESPSSLQLWSLELKVKLYIIGKSWEMNQMFEKENDCVVLFSVGGPWVDNGGWTDTYSLRIHSITVWRQPKHSFTVFTMQRSRLCVDIFGCCCLHRNKILHFYRG